MHSKIPRSPVITDLCLTDVPNLPDVPDSNLNNYKVQDDKKQINEVLDKITKISDIIALLKTRKKLRFDNKYIFKVETNNQTKKILKKSRSIDNWEKEKYIYNLLISKNDLYLCDHIINIYDFISFINNKYILMEQYTGDLFDLIEKKISTERLKRIQNILFENQTQMNKSLVDKVVEVLVENLTDDKSKVFGRSEYMTSVIFNGKKSDIGKVVKVRIKDSNRNTLFGEIEAYSNQRVA